MISLFFLNTLDRKKTQIELLVLCFKFKREEIQERYVRQAQILPLKNDQYFCVSAGSLQVRSDIIDIPIDNTAVKSP